MPMGVFLKSSLLGKTMGVFLGSRFLDGSMALPCLSGFQGGYAGLNLHGVKFAGHVEN